MSMTVDKWASEANRWRQDSPGSKGWQHSPRPDAANKYFIVSTDTHMNEPNDVFASRLPKELAHRLPFRIEVDETGQKWEVTPGFRKVKAERDLEGDEEDRARFNAARSAEQTVKDMDLDGIDIQVAFPNKGMSVGASGDLSLIYPMAQVFNDWLAETFRPVKDRVLTMPIIPTADVDLAIKELDRIGKMGLFRGVLLPVKPIFGAHLPEHINYNLPVFDPFWARLQEMDLTVTIHIGTGKDPRGARGNGGAVINYTQAISSAADPVVHLCASGVFDKFPKLRVATIESGISWIPYMLQLMDEAYKTHYLWVRPKVSKHLPSEYFYTNCFSTFQEDAAGLNIIDQQAPDSPFKRLEDCFMWANDYPHHEGTWPQSAAAIERQMGHLTEEQRVKILGGNAIRCWKIDDLVAKRKASAKV